MKLSTVAAISCALVVFATAVAETWAGGRGSGHGGSRGASHAGRPHHAHSHTRVFVGSSFYYGPAFYPAPYYYAPVPVYVEPPPPAVYIEQGQDPETQAWHYCVSARAYYPYVAECPEGWQRVVPEFTPQQPSG